MLNEYVNTLYRDVIPHYYDKCPYDMDLDDDDQRYAQTATWFLYERKNHAGKTILDEFVDKFVDDKKLGTKILQMKNPIHDTFLIEKTHPMPTT